VRAKGTILLSRCLRVGGASCFLISLFFIPGRPAAAVTGYTSPVWTQNFANGDAESSPVVANLNGQNDIIFGSADGKVYALNGSNGANTFGFPVQTAGRGIMSSPSVADTNNDGRQEIFIGSGDARGNPSNGRPSGPGGYYSIDYSGGIRWRASADDVEYSNHSVAATMPIGDINFDNTPDVTAGAVSLNAYSFDENGNVNSGWPIYTDDSTWSSPALIDVNGDGQTDMVEGGDSTAGGPINWQGGILRAVNGSGDVIWQKQFDEIIRSSPVVGDIDGDGVPEIVVGTGNFWYQQTGGHTNDSKKIYVFDRNGNLKWARNLAGTTLASPTLADVNGDGKNDIIIGTWDPSGKIYVYDGNGTPIGPWNGLASPGGVILGQIVTADLTNDGKQDLLVPTGAGMYAFDGNSGAKLFALNEGNNWYQNSAWVGDLDNNGKIDLVVVGNTPGGTGVAQRYELTGAVMGSHNYPQFRYDARKTGNVNGVPLRQNHCTTPGGYRMVASDGGIFAFCDSNFYGSKGGQHLNAPMVNMATTPSGNGYWTVASDGGIFGFGDANYYGSKGGQPLNQPIVGMAATPSGHGYWLVARDGGIFAFGDANYYGSKGGQPLNEPIVGMAATPSGHGYWLVARDGGIFAFGDANYYGSKGGQPLNAPIVGMIRTSNGGGYLMIASDGGIFTFGNGVYRGGMGGQHLNAPIIGITETPDHAGYWLVASDGGIFSYGTAHFFGSMGGHHLNQPIVGTSN
jgi:hypothetical protein